MIALVLVVAAVAVALLDLAVILGFRAQVRRNNRDWR
jgi:hypothetical protein